MLMQSPLAKGLFARAIIQSGPGLFPSGMTAGTPLAEAEKRGVQFAKAKGVSTLAELRALTPEQLMAPAQGAPRFGPVADSYFLSPDNPNQNQVSVINGFTADDLGAGGGFDPPREATVTAFENEARRLYGDRADTFLSLSLYRPDSDDEVPALRKASGRDRARVSLHLWASQQDELSRDVYTYYFDPGNSLAGTPRVRRLPYERSALWV